MTADPSASRPPQTPLRLQRSDSERTRPDLLDALRADARTRVIRVRGDAVPVTGDALSTVPPSEVDADAEWAFLGRDDDGAAALVAAERELDAAPADGWGSLRRIGGDLTDADAARAVAAVSLGRWLTDNRHCPSCGSGAPLTQAGWARRCETCARDLFPRTDPAVIVAVTSADTRRLLLGSNVQWAAGRFSCFAGFVEAGESLEGCVAREVSEECGIDVADVRYRGSQAWPYPRSLMVGFQARAADDDRARADEVEIAEVRWFTRGEIAEALAGEGEITLPGRASIAHRLIRAWCAEDHG